MKVIHICEFWRNLGDKCLILSSIRRRLFWQPSWLSFIGQPPFSNLGESLTRNLFKKDILRRLNEKVFGNIQNRNTTFSDAHYYLHIKNVASLTTITT